MFQKKYHIHFVGIGGIGMSGIAELLLNLGYKVSGSDLAETDITVRLANLGGCVYRGHGEQQVHGADVVVISSAVKHDNPEVRAELASQGLKIPEDTWFLPAKHNTTSDRIDFYDLVDLPDSHRDDLEKLRKVFVEAGEQQALERCARIPGTPRGMTAKQAYAHVEARCFDWANTRPEWGLSGNAAFTIGRRVLTKGISLGGRSLIHWVTTSGAVMIASSIAPSGSVLAS